MRWLSANWIWVVLIGAMLWMHLRHGAMHGGHGRGHDGHRDERRRHQAADDAAPTAGTSDSRHGHGGC